MQMDVTFFQYCQPGYVRLRITLYREECHPCKCNNKSDLCDGNTGICIVSYDVINWIWLCNCYVIYIMLPFAGMSW